MQGDGSHRQGDHAAPPGTCSAVMVGIPGSDPQQQIALLVPALGRGWVPHCEHRVLGDGGGTPPSLWDGTAALLVVFPLGQP